MSHELEYRYCPVCGGSLKHVQIKDGEPKRLVCSACRFVFYLDPKVASGTVVEMKGGVVLLKRGIGPAYGKWVIPGGFVDRYETPAQAAVRETWEEARIRVEVGGLVGLYAYEDSYVIVVVYSAKYQSGTLSAGDESLQAAIFPLASIPWDELAFPSTRDALRDYLKQQDRSVHDKSR